MDGTSMATPFVAGVAGLLKSININLTPAQIRKTIEKAADDLGDPGFDQLYGYGRLNALNSLQNLYVPEVYPTIQEALNLAINRQKIIVAAGNYSVTNSLTVSSGVTLEINSGANIIFSAGTQLTINGLLKADGVTFGASDGSYWKGIN
jgi:subtilisin family serine protease